MYPIVPLRNYSHCTLTQNLPGEAYPLLPIYRNRFEMKSEFPQAMHHASNSQKNIRRPPDPNSELHLDK